MKASVLVVDDDPVFREATKTLLSERGFSVDTAPHGEAGLEKISNKEYGIIISDLFMFPLDGISFVREVRKSNQDSILLMVTGQASVETAVEAMKLGADDYIVKPWAKGGDELFIRLDKLLEKRQAQIERYWLRKEIQQKYTIENFIGQSSKMQQTFKLIEKAAASDVNCLLLGETGTGKEMAAHAIHSQSLRRDRPMVIVNCPAYSSSLLESELFGHEKGAFTGAVRQKPGRFELADQGTLFIDEVGDLPISTQAKLLRFLQEKEFERVGGTETILADVRVIAATNLDLKKMIDENKFRSDLYFRLNVFPIVLAPLRERREDIPLLAQFFLKRSNERYHKNIVNFSPDVIKIFMKYSWPGNVRELENVIERAVLMEEGDIVSDILLERANTESPQKPLAISQYDALSNFPAYHEQVGPMINKMEKEYFSLLLRLCGGNIKLAFEKSKLSRNTVSRKMKEYGLDKRRFKGQE